MFAAARDTRMDRWEDIVLDTSAFIQGEIEPLRALSDRLWTLEEVLKEVKDSKAKSHLQFALDVLPENVKVFRPSRESIDFVIAFAKQTGDYPALSKTDLLVIAAAHELRGKTNDVGLISSKDIEQGEDYEEDEEQESRQTEKPTTTSSAVVPGKSWASVLGSKTSSPAAKVEEPDEPEPQQQEPQKERQTTVMWDDDDFDVGKRKTAAPPVPLTEQQEEWPTLPISSSAGKKPTAWTTKPPSLIAKQSPPVAPSPEEGEKVQQSQQQAMAKPQQRDPQASRILSLNPGVSSSKDQDEAGQEDEDWAKPGSAFNGWGNTGKKTTAPSPSAATTSPASSSKAPPPPVCPVACATADFALQNVLLQLKLGIVSLDGRRITSVKNWVLKCDACLKIFPATEHKLFCSWCGHPTLARLAYSIDAQGNRRYHYSKSRRIKTQGNVYSIPNKADLLLREDQLLSGIWAQRASRKKNSVSIFGEDVNDTLGVGLKAQTAVKVGYGSQNPNSKKGRERRGAKKKN